MEVTVDLVLGVQAAQMLLSVAYEFKDPQQLLSDFFADVDRVLEQVKK